MNIIKIDTTALSKNYSNYTLNNNDKNRLLSAIIWVDLDNMTMMNSKYGNDATDGIIESVERQVLYY